MADTNYFYRNVMFSKKGKTISIIDINSPKTNKEELEPWFAMVFQLADGQHTTEELFSFLSTKYTGNPPTDLKQTLESVIERMVQGKLIVLTDIKTNLPYYLSMPYELLDIEKAKKIMMKDNAEFN